MVAAFACLHCPASTCPTPCLAPAPFAHYPSPTPCCWLLGHACSACLPSPCLPAGGGWVRHHARVGSCALYYPLPVRYGSLLLVRSTTCLYTYPMQFCPAACLPARHGCLTFGGGLFERPHLPLAPGLTYCPALATALPTPLNALPPPEQYVGAARIACLPPPPPLGAPARALPALPDVVPALPPAPPYFPLPPLPALPRLAGSADLFGWLRLVLCGPHTLPRWLRLFPV